MQNKKKSNTSAVKFSTKTAVSALLGAWLVTLIFTFLLRGKEGILLPDYLFRVSPFTFIIIFAISAAALLGYGYICPAVAHAALPVITLVFCVMGAFMSESYLVTFALCGIMCAVIFFSAKLGGPPLAGLTFSEIPADNKTQSNSSFGICIAAISVICGLLVTLAVLARYFSYSLPASSTGVYGQLLSNLRSDLSQLTTLEYGVEASHFAFHFSPIFYVLLPFYALIPSEATLIVISTAALYSSVIPLCLIARGRGLGRSVTALICAIFCIFPTVTGGLLSGVHEYAFLLPLLLWFIYACEKKNCKLMILFAALLLCVRETAAIYIAVIALYQLIDSHGIRALRSTDKAEKRTAVTLFALLGASVVYITVAFAIIESIGHGTLIYRYQNISGVGGGFGEFFRAVFTNPIAAIYEILTPEKMNFLLAVLLPLAFLPLFAKKGAAIILAIPLILFNLIADYSYFYNLNYPYTLGTTALLFYLAVVSLSGFAQKPSKSRHAALACMVCFSLTVGAFRVPDVSYILDYPLSDDARSDAQVISEVLDSIPEDASVSAASPFCTHLTHHKELYALHQEVDTEYVVIDLREGVITAQDAKYDVEYYKENGFSETVVEDGIIALMAKDN